MALPARWRNIAGAACLVSAVFSCLVEGAATGVFYQPLNRDRHLTAADWRSLMLNVRQAGYKQLVVQWSQYGEQHFLDSGSPVTLLLDAAREQALDLWLGLSADPEQFKHDWTRDSRRSYLESQFANFAANLKILPVNNPELTQNVAGWFIPLELFDLDLTSSVSVLHLKKQLRALQQYTNKPIMISVFANGQLAPILFRKALQQLQMPGLQLWLQDGSGAALVSPDYRKELLAALDCDVGLIVEAFRDGSYDGEFAARSASSTELQQALAEIKPCHNVLLFSLRYLSLSNALLPLKD